MLKSSRTLLLLCVLALLGGCGGFSRPATQGYPRADVARGAELYRTYCSACHTAQAHWRDQRLVKSWGDLRYQIARWQRIAGQNWSGQEIDDVAAYLNRTFYQLSCPLPGCDASQAGAGTQGVPRAG